MAARADSPAPPVRALRAGWWGTDPVITACFFILSLTGLLFVLSSTWDPLEELSLRAVWVSFQSTIKQMGFIVVGTALYFGASRIRIERGAIFLPLLILTVGMLVVVLIFGHTQFGSTRWLRLGVLSLQPAEFAKPAFILMLAHLLSPRPGESRLPSLAPALGLTLIISLLVVLEPDLGTALIFVALFFVGALVAGYPLGQLAGIGGVMGLFALPGWFLMRDYMRQRILGFIEPGSSAYWQVRQAAIAIGSGGLLGKGLFKGSQKEGGFIFGAHNDFIFSVISEEAGFVGGVFVLVVFVLLIGRLLWLRVHQGDRFAILVSALTGGLIGLQMIVHVGMNLGLLPVTGISLPLVSYGGSSYLATALALGLAQAGMRR